jgi:hypothetical protein
VGVEFPISLEVQISLITPERKDIADLRADADDAGFERADMVAARHQAPVGAEPKSFGKSGIHLMLAQWTLRASPSYGATPGLFCPTPWRVTNPSARQVARPVLRAPTRGRPNWRP